MTAQDIRKLAHKMLDELNDEQISEVIQKMHHMRGKLDKEAHKSIFPVDHPSHEELRAINKAKKEFHNGEYYTHEDVFSDEDHV